MRVKKNLPNIITIFRFFLLIPFLILIFGSLYFLFRTHSLAVGKAKYLLISSGFVFLIAMLSDLLDGYIARKRKIETMFGKIFDPVADKIMCTAALITLMVMGLVPFWLVMIFVLRDVFMGGVRNLAAFYKKDVKASKYGKFKTFFLSIGILIILFAAPFIKIKFDFPKIYINPPWQIYAINAFLKLAAILAIISMIFYWRTLIKKREKEKK